MPVVLVPVLAVWLGTGAIAGAATLGDVIEEAASTNDVAGESQKTIDGLSENIDDLVTEYRRTVRDTKALRVYSAQVEKLLRSQEEERASLQKQIDNVTVIGREVVPLMLRMIDTLESFVGLDMPFLPQERRNRVLELRSMMDRADVTISEKYRRIVEAYQIENEYGRTIEAYRGPLERDGASRTVDFLRVGRVALLYQTLDGQESGMWDANERRWVGLPGSYRTPVRDGLRMARKQVAPDLVAVPVPAAKGVGR
jgi:hypothetical protein